MLGMSADSELVWRILLWPDVHQTATTWKSNTRLQRNVHFWWSHVSRRGRLATRCNTVCIRRFGSGPLERQSLCALLGTTRLRRPIIIEPRRHYQRPLLS